MRFDTKTLEFEKIIHEIEKYTATAMGINHVRDLKPIFDFEKIEVMLHETFEGTLFIKEGLAPIFSSIQDISEALKRAKLQGVLAVRDFLDILLHIQSTKRIKREMYRLGERLEQTITLESYASLLESPEHLSKRIKETIDEQGQILSSASIELKTIRHDIDVSEKRIKQALESVLKKDVKKLTEQLITMRFNRYVVPVKISEKNNFSGTILDYSSSGETAYIEPDSVRELTSTKMRLEVEEAKEIEKILYQLTLEVAQDYDCLLTNNKVLGQLDFIFAKAYYAYETDCVKPKLGKKFHLIKARHPLISEKEIVPNTITFDEGVKTMVITGSNTGGKTVTLKTAGLLAIMVQSGLLIPVHTGSIIPIFKQIRADIGDEQSIEQSLSTFSSHMSKIVDIIKTLEDDSLILLDELGSGTDPNEGSSLAMSILDELDSKNVYIMATTHYPELKAYAYTKSSIVNASVEFDEQSLKPTYRLLIRTPGESHAFLISERLGLPSRIIDNARNRVLQSNTEVNDLIVNLKNEGQRLDKAMLEYESLIKDNKHINNEVNTLKKTLQEERETLKEKLIWENRQKLETLKNEALTVINELEMMKSESFKEHELADLKYKVRTLHIEGDEDSKTKEHQYQIGDMVYILKFNRHGELIKKQQPHQWLIKMGSLKSVFKESEFEYVEDVKKKQKPVQTLAIKPERKNVSGTLDLRGMRVLEALEELNKYLDDCTLSGMPFATIIHGFGTLALRKMVQETLLSHQSIKSFRDGEGNEGGKGVTIVYFK